MLRHVQAAPIRLTISELSKGQETTQPLIHTVNVDYVQSSSDGLKSNVTLSLVTGIAKWLATTTKKPPTSWRLIFGKQRKRDSKADDKREREREQMHIVCEWYNGRADAGRMNISIGTLLVGVWKSNWSTNTFMQPSKA